MRQRILVNSGDSSDDTESEIDEVGKELNTNTVPEDSNLDTAFKDAWNKLDTLTEHQMLSKTRRYSTISQTVKTAVEKVPVPVFLKDRRASSVIERDLAKFQVPASYEGPKLSSGPITIEQAKGILSFYTSHPNDNIPYRYAHKIVRDAKRLFQEANQPLINLTIPKEGKIVVVGDIHGQLLDLFTILRLASFPSEKNYILFNGDIVDRGPHGPSVVFVILALKLAYPESIYINRGNHETASMNEWYNFADQMRVTYDQEILDYVSAIWRWLPYVTLIDNQVFVVHGGLPAVDDFTLDDVKKITLGTDLSSKGEEKTRTQLVMEGLLWSDPSQDVLTTAPSPRGAGVLFGKQWAKDFLTRNNLKVIVRSHELTSEGYQTFFGNRVITIFSASCYDYTNDNRGAILTFEYGLEDYCAPIVSQYFAELPSIVKNDVDQSHTMRARRAVSTLYRIKEMIFKHKHELLVAFNKIETARRSGNSSTTTSRPTASSRDTEHVFEAHISNSIKNSNSSIPENIPKASAITNNSTTTSTTTITATSTTTTTTTTAQSAPITVAPVPVEIAKRGCVSLDEWSQVLAEVLKVRIDWSLLLPYLISQEEKNEFVWYSNFLKRYVANKKFTKRWVREIVAQIATIIFNMSLDINGAFSQWDLDADGYLSYSEVHNILTKECSFGLNTDQTSDFMLLFDRDLDGYISLQEFHKCLEKEWKNVEGAAQWLNDVREKISEALASQFDIGLRASFKHFNKSGNGKLTFEEFILMLKEIKLYDALAEEDREAIFGYLDTEDLKFITSKQFKRAFTPSAAQPDKPKESTGEHGLTENIENAIVVQQVVDVLSEYRLELQKEFRLIDVERSGTITVEEFKAVILATNQHLDQKLTTFQLSKLFEHLDVDSYGFVLYEEFLSACESATRMPLPSLTKEQEKIEKFLSDV